MLFLFLFVLFVFFLFLWGAVRCANPYRLIFVFGKKGSGKSCYMVSQMLRFRRRGWNIYTDMADVNIPGVYHISVAQLSEFRPLPRSLVCLDEVGISMDNRSYKSFPPGLRDFFKYVRKMKCRVIINSQAFDVDKKVRDTVDSMLLASSVGPVAVFRPIRRSVTLVEPTGDSEGRIADRLSFTFFTSWRFLWLPSFFPYFDTLAMPQREIVPVAPSPGNPLCARPPLFLSFYRCFQFFKNMVKMLLNRRIPLRPKG